MLEKHRIYFNELAPVWDQLMSNEPYERLDEIFNTISISSNSNILDVGTGTGVMLAILKKIVGSSGQIVALDISEEMLLRAKEKNGEESIDYIQGDIAASPFENQSFDVIICNSCFPHFIDKQASINEMARILKPGGQVIICHLSSRTELNSMHQSLGGIVGSDMLLDNETMILMFKEAGFTDITINDQEDRYILTARIAKSSVNID